MFYKHQGGKRTVLARGGIHAKENCDMEKILFDQALEFVEELESLFGPRDSSFSLRMIDIKDEYEYPHTYYSPENGKLIDIRLTVKNVSENIELAKWQLAHECVHLIDPWQCSIWGPTNFLEEGLATWHQNSRINRIQTEFLYAKAEWMVMSFIDDLIPAIKHIRSNYKLRIGEIPFTVLMDNCPRIGPDFAKKMCERFE